MTDVLFHLTLQHYIRLVWIIGGYLFLRPYIELGFRKLFSSQKERTGDVAGTADNPLQDEDAGMGDTTSTTGWGADARKRQAIVMQAWEEEQAKIAEANKWDGIDPELLED